MENKKLVEFIEIMDCILLEKIEFHEPKIKSDIYEIIDEIVIIDDLLLLVTRVTMLPFSEEVIRIEIVGNIFERAIKVAEMGERLSNFKKIANKIKKSIQIDDLTQDLRDVFMKIYNQIQAKMNLNGISLKIKFDNVKLSLNTSNLIEKSKLVDSFWKNGAPIIKNWSEEEIFSGLYRKVCHLEYVGLRLIPDGEYIFVESLAEYSNYTITYDKFSNFETLKISFEEKFIIINGDVSLKVNLKDIVYKDFIESKLVHFDELGIRVSPEIFHFTKYGDKLEQEKIESQEYMAGSSLDYIANRPIIEFM